MSETKPGLQFHFSEVKGGNPTTAVQKHFLGAKIEMSVNEASSATLEFLLPTDNNGILSESGLPPLTLSVSDAQGNTLFKGNASSTTKGPGVKPKSVRITYHDPLYCELSDESAYTYPTGTLADICASIAKEKNIRFAVDSELSHQFPSGGGTPVRCLTLLVGLAEQAGAYVVYDAKADVVRIKRWTPKNPFRLSKEQLIHSTGLHVDAQAALTTFCVYGRKGLKNDWEETKVAPKDASLALGQMGSEADAWVREAKNMRTRTTIAHNRTPSETKQLASDLLSATVIRAVRGDLTLRNAVIACGDTISLPATSMTEPGDFLVERVIYDFTSASLIAKVQGVRA